MRSLKYRPGKGGTLAPWHVAPDLNCLADSPPVTLPIPQTELPKFSNVIQAD